MPTFTVILAAAGKSSRFKDDHYKKPFAILNRKAVWLHSADRFLKRDDVKQVIIVIAKEDRSSFLSKFGANLAVLGIDVVEGGVERCDSVNSALAKVDASSDLLPSTTRHVLVFPMKILIPFSRRQQNQKPQFSQLP